MVVPAFAGSGATWGLGWICVLEAGGGQRDPCAALGGGAARVFVHFVPQDDAAEGPRGLPSLPSPPPRPSLLPRLGGQNSMALNNSLWCDIGSKYD